MPRSLFIPPENIMKNIWVSDIFRGYRMRLVVWNGLMQVIQTIPGSSPLTLFGMGIFKAAHGWGVQKSSPP